MFTGIVAARGEVLNADRQDGQARLRFATGELDLQGTRLGDSIAVNGVCLTVVEVHSDGFTADLSRETLDLTTLSAVGTGAAVNLERALALGEELGGHLVTGHIDGVARVVSVVPDSGSLRVSFEVPEALARYIAHKGSVCVDGTSLTVNGVENNAFEVMIVPHTQKSTIINQYAAGTQVNIEVDMIARYLERLLQYTGDQPKT
jgi:riboflavin synthase